MNASGPDEVARLLRAGDAARALECCRAALSSQPKHPQLLFLAGVAAMQAGMYGDAVGYFEAARALNPTSPELANNLGTALIHANQPEKAETVLSQTVSCHPDYVRAHVNLAAARRACGDLEAAEQGLREACARHGGDPTMALTLADVLLARGKRQDAIAAVGDVLAQDPGNPSIRRRLVGLLIADGRIGDAVSAARAIPHGVTSGAEDLGAFGDMFYDAGRLRAARVLYADALRADPSCFAGRVGMGQVDRRLIARWHFSMLNDRARNDAYDRAIRAAVGSGDIVLDIGTGSGILAMMAARAGAGHVYACESVPEIAAKAREIIAANGLDDRITVIDKMSHDLVVGTDLPRRADTVVSEIVDNLLIGEGIMATVAHALDELVRPGAQVIPRAGTVYAVPIESARLFACDRAGRTAGFDVSPFNEFTRYGNYTSDLIGVDDFTALGPAVELFRFDFTVPRFGPESKRCEIACDRDGSLHGLLVWFALELSEGVSIDNRPGTGCSHWGHAVFFLDRPRPVASGVAVPVVAAHDTTTIDIRFVGTPDG